MNNTPYRRGSWGASRKSRSVIEWVKTIPSTIDVAFLSKAECLFRSTWQMGYCLTRLKGVQVVAEKHPNKLAQHDVRLLIQAKQVRTVRNNRRRTYSFSCLLLLCRKRVYYDRDGTEVRSGIQRGLFTAYNSVVAIL